jgi:ribose transport system permease protein
MEGAVPVAFALLIAVIAAISTPEIFGTGDRDVLARLFAESTLIAMGLTIVLLAGGFDMSVASMTGMAAISSLVFYRVYELPVGVVLILTILLGALLGSVNGALIAWFDTRPFVTTLVTALTYRAVVQFVQGKYSDRLVFPRSDATWSFLGDGKIAGIPTSLAIVIPLLVIAHVFLSRSRWGWWIAATGSDTRSARRNGISVRVVTFGTYVASGMLCALAGFLLSARQGNTSSQVASGYEIAALTAVVLGGVSLFGGRGTVIRAAIGALVVVTLSQAVFRSGFDNAFNGLLLAVLLLGFAVLDQKWGKYRRIIADKISVSPIKLDVEPVAADSTTGVWETNFALSQAQPIGLGLVEGPEDVMLDNQGRLYCGDRRGWVWRFWGENFEHHQVFARTGGRPLAGKWDHDGNLVMTVGGIGVCRFDDKGKVEWLATRTKRSRGQLFDDAAIRFADDLDVAPDGSIYFSDASTRISQSTYYRTVVEYRPDGRLLRIDPDNGAVEPITVNHAVINGITTSHDGNSILMASTTLFRVDRLWISGEKQGKIEPVLENLPGCPDNIRRASDGNYWLSFVGMRTPFSDLILKHTPFRKRMIRELPVDDWIVPQWNVSCVAKFSESGEILSVMWDGTQERHPMVTSTAEHQGYLYLGGIENNRVGRVKLPPEEVGPTNVNLAVPSRSLTTASAGVHRA